MAFQSAMDGVMLAAEIILFSMGESSSPSPVTIYSSHCGAYCLSLRQNAVMAGASVRMQILSMPTGGSSRLRGTVSRFGARPFAQSAYRLARLKSGSPNLSIRWLTLRTYVRCMRKPNRLLFATAERGQAHKE
jgi:hypothetical protein